MSQYLDIIRQGGPWVIVLLVLVFLVLVYAAMRLIKGSDINRDTSAAKQGQVKTLTTAGQVLDTTEQESKPVSLVGTGNYRAMVIKPGIIDFTHIPDDIGEMYQADPSLPMGGGIFIVREVKDTHNIIDYDPRKVPVSIDELPERAFFAINWEIVTKVFSVPGQWWQSTSNWWAMGITVITFIIVLVTLD